MTHGMIFVLSYFAWFGLILFALVGAGLCALRGE